MREQAQENDDALCSTGEVKTATCCGTNLELLIMIYK